LAVKHRQLARQVGVIIDDPLANSMATFNFISTVPDESPTFTFGSWTWVADGAGDFHQHLVDNAKPEAPAATPCSDLGKSIDNLGQMLLPNLARELEEESIFNMISTRAAPGLLRLEDPTTVHHRRPRGPGPSPH
jgi:hypothetical protein